MAAQPEPSWFFNERPLIRKIHRGDRIRVKHFSLSHSYGTELEDEKSNATTGWGDYSGFSGGSSSESTLFVHLLQRSHLFFEHGGLSLGDEGSIHISEYAYPSLSLQILTIY